MRITPIDPQPWSYAQGALVTGGSRVLFVSGQVPETEDEPIPSDFESQCRLAWRNVLAVLAAADMTAANLAKVTIFLSDRTYRETDARVRQEVLRDACPAMTIIITGIYDESWLLEIEAIAVA